MRELRRLLPIVLARLEVIRRSISEKNWECRWNNYRIEETLIKSFFRHCEKNESTEGRFVRRSNLRLQLGDCFVTFDSLRSSKVPRNDIPLPAILWLVSAILLASCGTVPK